MVLFRLMENERERSSFVFFFSLGFQFSQTQLTTESIDVVALFELNTHFLEYLYFIFIFLFFNVRIVF